MSKKKIRRDIDKENLLFINIPEALIFAEKFGIKMSVPTAIKNISKNHFGHQLGGKGSPWAVHRGRWEDFLTGRCKQLPGEDYEK